MSNPYAWVFFGVIALCFGATVPAAVGIIMQQDGYSRLVIWIGMILAFIVCVGGPIGIGCLLSH